MRVLRKLSAFVLTAGQWFTVARLTGVGLVRRNVSLRWVLVPATIAVGLTASGAPDVPRIVARPVTVSGNPLMAEAVVVSAPVPTRLPCSNNEMSFMNSCPDAATVSPNSGGNTWMVFLLNETDGPLSGTLSCEYAGQVSSCTLSESNYSMPANESFGFTVTYDVGEGSGTVTVTASHWQQPISLILNV